MKVWDMHCDTLAELRYAQQAGKPKSFLHNDLMMDLERMKQGDYLLQCMACFVHLEPEREKSPLLDCLEEIEKMEKEGARFMDVSKTDVRKKKRTGAIAGAVVMILLMAFTIVLILWANTQDPIPLGLLLLITAIPVIIIIGTLIALAGRMKEIEGGEEDEASKY